MKYFIIAIVFASVGLFAAESTQVDRSLKYQSLCEKNHFKACYELGLLKSRANDLDMAKRYYGKACEGDELRACNNLGNIIRREGNLEYAKKLFKKACDKDNQTACHNQQFLSEVLKQNKLKASCELDDGIACIDLGRMYLGLGRVKSAKKVFQRACEKKVSEACDLLKKM